MIDLLYKIIEIIALYLFIMSLALFYQWIDRKVVARFQNRMGPTYVGPIGLLQPLYDFLKLLLKEDITPKSVNKTLFTLTPLIAVITILTATILLPLSSKPIVSFEGDIILAIVFLSLYAIIVFLMGTGSQNRFAILGSERTLIQLIGYEIPLTLSIISVVIWTGQTSILGIVEYQKDLPLIFSPLVIAFIIYILTSQAELERQPFDIPEAEQEIVAGWHVEYTGRKFALILLSHDIEMVYLSMLGATLFLGGFQGPMIPGLELILGIVYLVIKSIIILLLLSMIKASLARVRIDQMLTFSWKYLIPLALLQVLIIGVIK